MHVVCVGPVFLPQATQSVIAFAIALKTNRTLRCLDISRALLFGHQVRSYIKPIIAALARMNSLSFHKSTSEGYNVRLHLCSDQFNRISIRNKSATLTLLEINQLQLHNSKNMACTV